MTGVCFLDIDGVICTDRAYHAYGHGKSKRVMRAWDPICIKLVEQLCKEFDLQIVISSTWRIKHDVPEILLSHGLDVDIHPCEVTPRKFSSNRGMEIDMWLSNNETARDGLILILDDDTTGMDAFGLSKYQVETDSIDGILTHHYHAARNILNGQRKSNKKT